MRRASLLLLLLLLPSCDLLRSRKYALYPENPFEDISTVAVLPFLNETTAPLNGDEMGNIFATELAKFPGFRVVRPLAMRALLPAGKTYALEDLLAAARTLKADVVIAVSVTDYDPYYPPKMAVTFQAIRTSPRHFGEADDIDLLSMSARFDRPMPVSVPPGRIAHLDQVFDSVFDGHNRGLQDEIDEYLDAQNRRELGFKDLREFLMVESRFVQFVSCQLIFQMMEAARYSA